MGVRDDVDVSDEQFALDKLGRGIRICYDIMVDFEACDLVQGLDEFFISNVEIPVDFSEVLLA